MERRIIKLCLLLLVATTLLVVLLGCAKNQNKPGKSTDKNSETKKLFLNYLEHLESFPSSFTYGDKTYKGFDKDFQEIDRKSEEKSKSELTVITLKHNDGKLQVTIEAEYYNDYNAYEWTLWFENVGGDNTEAIKDINSADIKFTGSNPILKGINGDGVKLHSHYEKNLTELQEVNVESNTGRPTHSTFPYYNLEYADGGVLLAIGWAGCFRANFTTNDNSTSYTAGLYDFDAYLKPGEKIRTPLMSFVYYSGRNENDTMNLWRKWYIECNMPTIASEEVYTPKLIYHPGRMTSLMLTATEDKFIKLADKIKQEGIEYDILHMDAGWYTNAQGATINSWLETGSWEVNKTKFPTGFASLKELGLQDGFGTGLWFEPEWFRINVDTFVQRNPEFNKDWLIYLDAAWTNEAKEPWYLLNIGNDEAWQWIFDRMCSVIDVAQISILKIDFNADPGPSWRYQDEAEGLSRKGITENYYIQGYYKLYEALRAKYPDMMIGSCASGGGRNDLETMRLAVIMNATDYNSDDSEVKQGMNWSLAQWIPYHDSLTRQSGSQKVNVVDLYDVRSNYSPSWIMAYNLSQKSFDWDTLRQAVNEWNSIKKYYYSNYYTLTDWNNNKTDWIGWMYFDESDQGGFIQMFRPENSKIQNQVMLLYGLDPNATYTISDPDGYNSITATGESLMTEGLIYNMPQPRYASLLYIEKNK